MSSKEIWKKIQTLLIKIKDWPHAVCSIKCVKKYNYVSCKNQMLLVRSCTLEVLEGTIQVNAIQMFRKVDENFCCRISWQSVIERKDFARVAWHLPAVRSRGPSKSSGSAGSQRACREWAAGPQLEPASSCCAEWELCLSYRQSSGKSGKNHLASPVFNLSLGIDLPVGMNICTPCPLHQRSSLSSQPAEDAAHPLPYPCLYCSSSWGLCRK